ncbi:hypothetical protein K439DRAFT_1622482 [Ramaria rubella]|nr:hypothetical protein K439DRAFT_1622482 [Ramaria rubella]
MHKRVSTGHIDSKAEAVGWVHEPVLIKRCNDALKEEECLASAGKHHTKYLHLQEPTKLADFLEVQPEDANVANPEKYILKWHEQPKTHDAEVTFQVQGYLVDFNLPPILHSDQNRLPWNVAWAKQMVRVSGLGGHGFHQSVMGFKTIHEIMTRRLPTNSCQTWQPSEYEGHVALDFQSPYFMRKSDEKLAQLPENVDPLGYLARRGKSKGLWPSLDSLVEYYERKIVVVNKKQLVRHEHTEPATLRRGYLVEVTIVFHLNHTKKGRWMLFTLVRAIEVLNQEIDKVSPHASTQKTDVSTITWCAGILAVNIIRAQASGSHTESYFKEMPRI